MKGLFKWIQNKVDRRLEKEFLPEALEIIEKPPSPIGNTIIWIIIFIVVTSILWMVFGEVDETVNARGSVETINGIQTIQSASNGVIKEILIKEGDIVQEGEELIYFENTVEGIDFDKNKKKLNDLEKKEEILNEILVTKDKVNVADSNNNEINDVIEYLNSYIDEYKNEYKQIKEESVGLEKQLNIEKRVLEKIKKEKENLKSKYEDSLKSLEQESTEEKILSIIEKDIKSLENKAKLFEDLYLSDSITKAELDDKNEELQNRKSEKELQVIKVEDKKKEKETNLKELYYQFELKEEDYNIQDNVVEQATKNIEKQKGKLERINKTFEKNIKAMIVENNDLIMEQKILVEEKERKLKAQVLTSPISGTIQQISVNTIGGVVNSAQPLITIVPNKSTLIFEADLLNKDVGLVEVGQKVYVKLDTYNFQKYGKVEGRVMYISSDSILNEKKGFIYKVKVEVDLEEFVKKNNYIEVPPGLEGTLEIKVGRRRIIEFFLGPLFEKLDGSLSTV